MSEKSWEVGRWPWLAGTRITPGVRVVVDNDFAGDPDDLFQLAHHLLSPACEVRAVVSSHLGLGDAFHPEPDAADAGAEVVRELADAMGLDLGDRLFAGSNQPLESRDRPWDSAGARAIVTEAMRDDPRPLFVACGGSLTEVASAWLLEPRISERVTVVWIGGPEYPGIGTPPPDADSPEYNLGLDLTAAQVVFDDSDLPLWIVPRDAYRQCLVSDAELRRHVWPLGPLGAHLAQAIDRVRGFVGTAGHEVPGTYVLGDQPLVLLTALNAFFQPDPSSSAYRTLPCPTIADDGSWSVADGRPVRVWTHVDQRLMFGDMVATFADLADWQASGPDVS